MSHHGVAITVAGEMSDVLRAEFDDLEVRTARGVTRLWLRGDQSALHGVIHRLESLGLELLDMERDPG